jgi:hypothetical protein
MTNFKMKRIHDEIAALAAQQAAINKESPRIIAYPICVTWEDIDRWMEAFRRLPLTAEDAAIAEELLVESLLRTGQLLPRK